MPVPFCLETWLMCHFGILSLASGVYRSQAKRAWGCGHGSVVESLPFSLGALGWSPPLGRETENGNSMTTVPVATCTRSCHKIPNLPGNTATIGKKGCQCPSVPRSEDLTMGDLWAQGQPGLYTKTLSQNNRETNPSVFNFSITVAFLSESGIALWN